MAPPAAPDVLVAPLHVSRATPAYAVHAYHTKVPVEAIDPYVVHYTHIGEAVLDPFCGSGMTGLAAALRGRRAVLNDLSPAAVHIARNYTTPCPPDKLASEGLAILARARPTLDRLYLVSCPTCSGQATTEYVVWSDVRACPSCGSEVTVWDAIDGAGAVRTLTCPTCATSFEKSRSSLVGERPVEVNLSCESCGRDRIVIAPRVEDLGRAAVRREEVPFWYPQIPFGPEWEMWRGGHRDLGMKEVADFWTNRNLLALSVLHEAIDRTADARVREALRFVFTAIVNRASRRYQWNRKRPTNVLGGTLYIASLRYEWNVESLFRRKLRAAVAFYSSSNPAPGLVTVHQGSATDLRGVPSASIDYCFTDPPFGANIYYADSSLLWEAWLGDLTDRAAEAVVSRKRPEKSLIAYGELMAESFAEVRRCLKPSAVATVVFQNTDDAVWETIRHAALEAGLHVLGATTLHKTQPSFKGIKASQHGERVAASDVVMTFSPKRRATGGVTVTRDPRDVVAAAVRRELDRGTVGRRGTIPHLYAVAVSALVDAGLSTEGWSFERVGAVVRELGVNGSEQLPLGISD